MSTIDERIVSMKFDNNQFQKNAADTVSTLGKLRQSLNLEGAAKGLQGIDLSRLGASVDTIRSKFEGMNTVVTGILLGLGAQVTNFAIKAARDMGNNLIKGAREGFAEYETQMNAVQTIMANTSAKGTTMGQINDALAELNTYADKTIYNFSEMTRNIGTFTAAGVSLETSTAAIKGIANLAAVSGSNSQQASTAMYQLSQALASGTVKLMDWNSVVHAGMGGQIFQDALKETARAHGIAVDAMIDRNGSFRESLQEGWLTASVLTDTLAKFTGDLTREQILSMGYTEQQADEILRLGEMANDAATKVKTFSQLIGTLNEAVGSGWAQSWQIILGDFEEAKELFTEISDTIGGLIQESADARNEQLKIWKDLGGRTAVIDAMRNAFEAVMQIVTPIRDAFRDVFPPTMGKNLAAVSFALRDFTERLKIGEEGSKALYTVFKTVFSGLKIVLDLAGGALRIFFDNVRILFEFLGGIVGLLSPVITFLANLASGGQAADNRIGALVDRFIELRQMVVGPVIEALRLAGDAINEFLNGDPSRFSDMWKAAMAPLVQLGRDLRERYSNVVQFLSATFAPIGARIADNWQRVLDVVQTVWAALKRIGAAIAGFFGEIGAGFADLFEGADFDTLLAAINTGLLVGVVVAVRNAFKSITGIFDAAGSIGEGITSALEGVTGVLKSMQMNLKAEALLKIAGAIGILAASLLLLSLIDPNQLQQAAITMGVISAAILGILIVMERIMAKSDEVSNWSDTLKSSFTGISDSIKNNLNASALVKSAVALLILAGAIAIMAFAIGQLSSLSWEELSKGLLGVAVAMGLLTGAALVMSKFENSILKSAAAMVVMSAAIAAMAGAIAIFGNMPLDVLIQGGIAVALVLGALVGAAILLQKFAPQMAMSALGLMAMAVALNLLVIPIMALGLLPLPILTQGMLAVTVMLAGLVIVANMFANLGPRMALGAVGLMAMAVALNLLVIPIIALGMISMPVLIQGLIGVAAALAIMVIAVNAMTGAIAGAGAMIVMAGAIVILSAAVLIMGSMPLENMIQGLIGMAAAILILGVAGLVLMPIIPGMLGVAAAIAVLGVGLLLMSASVLVFSLAIMMLGPALMSVTAGLVAFAQQAGVVAAAVPAMLAIGAGLLVFGAGAAVAGVGILALGLGLIALGAGLAIVGAVGLIGATALAAVIKSMSKLTEHIPSMLLLTPTFIALGAAVLVLGAGLLVLGAGAVLTAAGLMLLVPLGTLVTFALNLVMSAIDKAVSKADKIATLASAMQPLGGAISKVGSAGAGAAAGILGATLAFTALAAASLVVRVAVLAMAAAVAAGVPAALVAVSAAAVAFQTLVKVSLASIAAFRAGISASVPAITASASSMARALTGTVARVVSSDAGAMGAAGYQVGSYITQGMSRGIQNGSYMVQAAARSVARQALAASKRELGVASPSKEYYKIGNWMDEGMAEGQIQNINKVETASEKVGKAAMDSMRDSLRGFKSAVASDMAVQPTIRPVLDMSSVKQGASQLGRMFNVPQLRLDTTRQAAAVTQSSVDRVTEERNNPGDEGPSGGGGQNTNLTFNQYITSPKAISPIETYRQGENLISKAKEEIAKR